MIELHTLDDISLLAESFDLECKRAGGRDGTGALPKDFWESYSAMANTEGGTVLLGIKQTGDRFSLNGIEQTDKVKKDLFDKLGIPESSPNLTPSTPNLIESSPISESNRDITQAELESLTMGHFIMMTGLAELTKPKIFNS
ncbi:MAG: hypothetical protein CML13_10055 [Puniceicoccaceae bacterium]|nr:hypothetical protein [Puniceicoccaceae bacterium]|tara:strand:- start:22266 stop:22691 length:426 start_codon:yes stop_codon:yes gene_type:complete